MAVLQKIRDFFLPGQPDEPETVVPAPPTAYSIRPLTDKQMKEVMRLNLRCFRNGDSYTKFTFSYLLSEPHVLSYRAVTPEGEMVGFVFVMIADNAGHLTTIGIAPEHRRRGLASALLGHVENALSERGVGSLVLEVRVSNRPAQMLYLREGYTVVQRLEKYYNNLEDAFLMIKALP